MERNCVICQTSGTYLVYSNYPGYVDGSFFNIYKCTNCDSHFIVSESIVHDLYNVIYSSSNTYGYDRYYKYMQMIRTKRNPIKYLAYTESTYYPIYKYLKGKKDLKILDVGCGYGYLTYALRQNGFNAFGLDIASNAINKAKENFGNYFYCADIKEFIKNTDIKFDLIVATELIEHLDDPNSFIGNCMALLSENGKIILTTPNKDYYKENTVWLTDLPPVHISWSGRKGIVIMAQKHNLKPVFTDFSTYFSKNENRLIRFLRTRKEEIGRATLTREGNPIDKVLNKSFFYKAAIYCLHKLPFVRFPSNFIYNIFINKESTLGAILEK